MLLNLSIFMWYGATAPWASFRTNHIIPLYRLVPLGILILLLRRIPFVFLVHKHIKQIEHWQQALFVGYFGPIGVSAIFYLYVSIDFLRQVTYDGHQRSDARQLEEVMSVVIWFLAICSIVVHGLSIPLGKVGYHLPRTVSSAFSISQEPSRSSSPIPLHARLAEGSKSERGRHSTKSLPADLRAPDAEPARPVFRPGGSPLRTGAGAEDLERGWSVEKPSNPPVEPAMLPLAGSEVMTTARSRTITFADSSHLAGTLENDSNR